ncbi:MAG: aminoacyl-tRNA hydrolase [Bacteroidetes bacterium]|nr:aminoacyl-tRNA hydrolase [Bacteroidota bacterium]
MLSLPDITALLGECTFTAVRSGGKGGQNVNKVSTKVILTFDVLNSEVLDEEQRALLLEKLMARISKEGLLQLNSSTERTQLGNRQEVEEKFSRLVNKAFHIPIRRIATKPTRGSKEKRLKDKKAVSGKKSARGGSIPEAFIDE